MRWFAWSFGRHPSWCERSRSTSLFVVPSDLVGGAALMVAPFSHGGRVGDRPWVTRNRRGVRQGSKQLPLPGWRGDRRNLFAPAIAIRAGWVPKRRPLDDRRGAP